MLIDALAHIFERTGAVKGFWDKLDRGEDAALGVASSGRPLMVAANFARNPRPTLAVVPGEESALAFARGVAAYVGDDDVLLFPSRDDLIGAGKFPSASTVGRRMNALWSLHMGRKKIVVASAKSLMRFLPPVSANVARPLMLRAGEELADLEGQNLKSLDDLVFRLEHMGYDNTGKLEGQGTFASKGDTLDVYPGNLSFPLRLDFFGDELESIRRIVPSTGQTIANLDDVEIYPVTELPFSKESVLLARKSLRRPADSNPALRDLYEQLDEGMRFPGYDQLLPWIYGKTATIGDYVHASGLAALVEPRSLFDDLSREFDKESSRLSGTHISVKGLLAKPEEVNFGNCQRSTYLSIMRIGGSVDDDLPIKRVDVVGNPDKLYGKVRTLLNQENYVVFSAPSYRVRNEYLLDFTDESIPVQEVLREHAILPTDKASRGNQDPSKVRHLKHNVLNVTDVDIPLGMVFPKAKLALMGVSDTQRQRKNSQVRSSIDITQITFPYKPGDYVVHAVHGIALFKGLVKQEFDGTIRDYLYLKYAGEGKLFVPVEQLDRVTRYVGPEGAAPRLTRLDSSDWSRALKKAGKATKKLAFDLVDVYARRATVQGFAFSPDTPEQREMEESFPYQETSDQLAAIADVKADMQAPKPMDRLVCGDVGFGKTEVALRAAFKATQDNKQVMVLCPTTILAQQHYTSFSERFEPFGVKVEVLSRFRTPAQQKAALAGFQEGEVQVLVGTHRLLSRDVNPHDLGLVIIDEEQRFGVGHKEQFKNLRESIDVLTLSATPIPRTLQMSISGVRDMSLILTPPDERRAVEVTVGEWDSDLVSAAIRREVQRGGQVYYVSNRVNTIDEAEERVRAAAEECRIGVAHGQMDKNQLEAVMEEFSAGELDVLIATTIIESGIDNPHTNTLIIEDSQRLGLAQMYQLKGRVGRSSTQAYAYFMFPQNVQLTEEAEARLTALSEHQELGSGMRIAMRDLEIRGAGQLMGAEQSGNMSAVGFDLYSQMLADAINLTREGATVKEGALPIALSDINVNIPGSAYLPEEYIPETDERVLWYRRLAHCGLVDDAEALANALEDAHPDIPGAALNLLDKTRIKALANETGIRLIAVTGGNAIIEPISLDKAKVAELRRVRARYDKDKKRLAYPMRNIKLEEEETQIHAVLRLIKSLRE